MSFAKKLGSFISKWTHKSKVDIETKEVGNYTLELKRISGGKYWDTLEVRILNKDGRELGSYDRNYSNFLDTFYPFTKNGKEYALYSPDYTSTRVMSLQDCKDLGGEDRNTYGFCPVEFFVPSCEKFYIPKEFEGNIGFVAGCVWGDDNSWKIQFLDLSRVEEGIITRSSDRLGYIELCSNNKLEDAIVGIEAYYDEEEEDWDIDMEIRHVKRYIFQWNERFENE